MYENATERQLAEYAKKRERVIEIKRKNVAERKSIRWGKRRRF